MEFDVDRFMKELKSATKHPGAVDGVSDVDTEEGSSSDMNFDEWEDENDMEEHSEDKQEDFMNAYTGVLNEELRTTTLRKSFVRATDQSPTKDEGKSNGREEDMEEDLTSVDVDVNLTL